MAKGSLSPSAIGTWRNCPRCFWVSKKGGVKAYRGIVSRLPSAMDEASKLRFDEYRVRGELPPEVAAHLPGARPFTDLLTLTQWRTLGRGMRAVIEGVEFVGLIDDLLVFGDNLVAPTDYKTTGSIKQEDYVERFYLHQVSLYDLLFQAYGFKTTGDAYFIVYSPRSIINGDGSSRTSTIEFDTHVLKIRTNPDSARQMIVDAAACLNGPLPPAKDGCELCTYVKARGQRMTEIVAEQKRQAVNP